MKHQRLKDMLAGAVILALLGGIIAPNALAALASKSIQVFTGVNIYVDDVKLNPQDANGTPVEVFVYNGTTYLPVRAVGEAVGKPVQWDGATSSVYLGKHTGEKPAVWLKDLDIFTSTRGWGWHELESDKANSGNIYTAAITPSINDLSATYLINGQYSAITGTLYCRKNVNYDQASTLKIYGDGELLYSATMTKETKPVDFSVNLSGVLELKIEMPNTKNQFGTSDSYYYAIADCGLWT